MGTKAVHPPPRTLGCPSDSILDITLFKTSRVPHWWQIWVVLRTLLHFGPFILVRFGVRVVWSVALSKFSSQCRGLPGYCDVNRNTCVALRPHVFASLVVRRCTYIRFVSSSWCDLESVLFDRLLCCDCRHSATACPVIVMLIATYARP